MSYSASAVATRDPSYTRTMISGRVVGGYHEGGLELLSLGDDDQELSNNCSDGIEWIYNTMGECVRTEANMAGFVLGFVSLLLWLIPLFPQLYENYRRKNCDGLSIYFLLFWFAGDMSNLIGAVLSEQLPIQIYISAYYIAQDMCLLGQFLYYNVYIARKEDDVGVINRRTSSAVLPCLLVLGVVGLVGGPNLTDNSHVYTTDGSRFVNRRLMHQAFKKTTKLVGYGFGCFSAVSYLCGRIPQLIKNYRRQSTEGVSVAMFVIIVFGNLTYGASVILGGEGWPYILSHLPWLVGSIGCCFCDSLVILQYFRYKTDEDDMNRIRDLDDSEQLLRDSESSDW